MNLLKRLFVKDKSPKTMCERVVRRYGFKNNTGYGTFHKDLGTFHCIIWVFDDRVKLKVYPKGVPYSEIEYIGPPLPNEKDLVDFIEANI